MNFYSPNSLMISDAAKLPDDVCVKLVMRHSIRYDNPPDGDYSNLMLTPEGIELSEKIGASLDRPLGFTASSPVNRCAQTLASVCAAMKPELKGSEYPDSRWENVRRIPELAAMKGDPSSKEKGGPGWFEYFRALQKGDTVTTRGVTLREEVLPIIDAIFNDGNEPGKLDIYCTHDSHIVMLASALFGQETGVNWDERWCHYTEGLFFYGTRDNFTAFWRGQQKTFVTF